MFDVWVALGFGLFGYILSKLKFPTSPMILGLILGPMAETGFRRGLQLYSGDFLQFFTRPIAVVFFLAAIAMMVFTGLGNIRNRKKEAASA
jgi:putative tricarboxylic transport membrane protein